MSPGRFPFAAELTDIGARSVGGVLVVLAVEHEGDGVVAVQGVNQVVRGRSGVQRVRGAIGFIACVPNKKVGTRFDHINLLSHCGGVHVVTGSERSDLERTQLRNEIHFRMSYMKYRPTSSMRSRTSASAVRLAKVGTGWI